MSGRVNNDQLLDRLLTGQVPAEQTELVALSAALQELRSATHVSAPQPSAALQMRLDAPAGAPVTAAAGDAAADATPGRKSVFEWIAGLGLATKIAAGSGVLALGLTGAGAAGALPGPAQDAFDSVVSTVLPTEGDEVPVEDAPVEGEAPVEGDETIDDGTETDAELPVGSDEFSSWVSENAKDPEKVGAEFGEQVSEQARELRDEKAAERGKAPEETPAPGDPEAPESDDESSDDETADHAETTQRGAGAERGRP